MVFLLICKGLEFQPESETVIQQKKKKKKKVLERQKKKVE